MDKRVGEWMEWNEKDEMRQKTIEGRNKRRSEDCIEGKEQRG